MKYKLNTRAQVTVNQMKLECLWQLEGFLGRLGIEDCSDIYAKLKRYYKIRI